MRFSSIVSSRAMTVVNKIGTHNGTFHCDEVLACSMLKLIYPQVTICRSRAPEVLSTCDIVVDVGGVYDPKKRLFDHHQKGFEHSVSTVLPGKPWTIKLSSAGLVYCHYGKDIIRAVTHISDDSVEAVFDRIYGNFIQEIDAIDNGIPICDGTPRYTITTHLSKRVGRLNSDWNQKNFDETKAFEKAMELVKGEFIQAVEFCVDSWLPARTIVAEALKNRFDVHESGEIMQLSQFCPWKSHFFELEEHLPPNSRPKYVLFDGGDSWRVQAVSLDENSFLLRVPLHEKWRGLREEDLKKESGIPEAIFVHATGFIGGAKTRDAAFQMACLSLANRSVDEKE